MRSCRHCGSLAGMCLLPVRTVPPRIARASAPPPGAGARGVRRAGRPGASRCARSTVPLLPAGQPAAAGAAPQRPAPDARASTRKQDWVRDLAPARARPGGQHRRQPRPPRRRCPLVLDALGGAARRPRASSSSAPTTTSRRRCATRCATCCPTTAAATPTRPPLPWRDLRPALADAGWLDLTNARDVAQGRRHDASRSPGVDDPHLELRRPRRRRRPGRPGRRRADRRRPRAVPPGARPVRRRRLRRGPRRPHPRRPGVPAGQAARWSPTATSSRPGPRGCTATRPTPVPGDPGLVLAARLGRARHLPVRPVRVCCRPEATLLTLTRADRPARPDFVSAATARVCSPCLAAELVRGRASGCGAAW